MGAQLIGQTSSRRFRGLRWAVVALILAACFPALGARASGVCDRYPLELSQDDLTAARQSLKLSFPAVYADFLSTIEVRNERDTEWIAPYTSFPVGRGKPVIVIPRGFRRLQCQLVQYQFYIMGGAFDLSRDMRSVLDDCVKNDKSVKRCVEMLAVAGTELIEKTRPYNDADTRSFYFYVDASFNYTLAHEVSHILMKGGNGIRPIATTLKGEMGADLMAMMALTIDGSPALSSVGAMAMLAMADNQFNWAEQEHPSAGCRAKYTAALIDQFGPEIVLAYTWLRTPDEYRKQRKGPREKLITNLYIPGAASGEIRGCEPLPQRQLQTVRVDIDALLRTLDTLPLDSAQRSDPQVTLDQLFAVRMKTPEGERLRTNVASYWLALRMVGFLDEDTTNYYGVRTPFKESWFKPFSLEIMSSQNYGNLKGLRAMMQFMNGPPGSSYRTMQERLTSQLAGAERYSPLSGPALMNRVITLAYAGKCREARALILRVFSTRPTDPAAEAQTKVVLDSIPDQEYCPEIARISREGFINDMKWRD